jgi:glutamine amidotransferase
MLAIIDYGVGNLTSVLNMFRRLGVDACITSDLETICKADKLMIPGVGHFDKCMQNFNASGLRPAIEEIKAAGSIPILGICVGAQMMTRRSEEGVESGLGWVEADTVRFQLDPSLGLKVPHMGWTDVSAANSSSPLFKNIPEEPRFYFAHSYHFRFYGEDLTTATCDYGYSFTCAFQKDNIFGVQFHPEKSHRFGMCILTNFAAL